MQFLVVAEIVASQVVLADHYTNTDVKANTNDTNSDVKANTNDGVTNDKANPNKNSEVVQDDLVYLLDLVQKTRADRNAGFLSLYRPG